MALTTVEVAPATKKLSTVEKALRLAALQISVFPWWEPEPGKKVPLTQFGHTQSSTDPEQIATWWTEHPRAGIGINAGASGLIFLDLDKKNGLDGELAIDGWLETPETWTYQTPTGGRHMVYSDPQTVNLAPSKNFQNWPGVDVRAGSSWAAYYADEVPASRNAFTTSPDWLLVPARDTVGSQFEGGLDEWLETLVDPDGEPNSRVLDAIGRIPESDFGHTEMVERSFEFIRLAAEGAPGVLHGLNLLRDAWLRPPYDTYNNRFDFDRALQSGIAKFGGLEDRIANLPKYGDLLQRQEVVNQALSKSRDKAHWFRAAKVFLRFVDTDDEVLSLLWSAPSTKDLSREWGIDFCAARVQELRLDSEKASLLLAAEKDDTQKVDGDKVNLSLLSDSEREYLTERPNFIHRYVDYAAHRFPYFNENYHRANAWTVLSLTMGSTGFTPLKGKNLGLNLFQLTLGDSSTGKSDSLLLRDEILRLFFAEDGEYDLGVEASGEVAHEHLLERKGAPTFFHADEAAVFFRELTRAGSWQAKLQDKITDWHGGYAGPVHKRAFKGDNKGGPCYLVSHFYGTPERLYSVMETDQFLSGFLARYQWSVGDPAANITRTVDDMQDDAPVSHDTDPRTLEIVAELQATVSHLGHRRPFKAGRAELARFLSAEKPMAGWLAAHSEWKITESAYRRLLDALRKCGALLAASRGSTHIEMVDVLGALEQAEVWLRGLVEAAANVSSSAFEREAREIAMTVKAKGKPWITEAALYRIYSRFEPTDFGKRLDWGIRTGMLTVEEANREHNKRYGWRGHEGDDDE